MAPKVNNELWRTLPSHARLNDLRNQQLQQSIGMGLSVFATMASSVLSASDIVPKEIRTSLLRSATDGANLLGDQFQSLSTRRRMDLKKFMNPEFAGICSAEVIIEKLAFYIYKLVLKIDTARRMAIWCRFVRKTEVVKGDGVSSANKHQLQKSSLHSV